MKFRSFNRNPAIPTRVFAYFCSTPYCDNWISTIKVQIPVVGFNTEMNFRLQDNNDYDATFDYITRVCHGKTKNRFRSCIAEFIQRCLAVHT